MLRYEAPSSPSLLGEGDHAKHGGGGYSPSFKDISPPPRAGTVGKARKLRRHMTLPEVLLWRELKLRPFGLKFRRQHASGECILDFYCNDARLAVEIDGSVHDMGDRPIRDERRDACLQRKGSKRCGFPPKSSCVICTEPSMR